MIPEERELLRTQLAEYAHAAWSGWMRYMLGKCIDIESRDNVGGKLIPLEFVARWTRQMETDYANLPDNEQASDLAEANRILNILEWHLSPERNGYRRAVTQNALVAQAWYDTLLRFHIPFTMTYTPSLTDNDQWEFAVQGVAK